MTMTFPDLSVYRENGRLARRAGSPRPSHASFDPSKTKRHEDLVQDAQREAHVQGWLDEDAYIRAQEMKTNQPRKKT